MFKSSEYLVKQALEYTPEGTLAGSMLTGAGKTIEERMYPEAFPSTSAPVAAMHAREALMDLGAEGTAMPREAVKNKLREIVEKSRTPVLPYALQGAAVGALVVPAFASKKHLVDYVRDAYGKLSKGEMPIDPKHMAIGAGVGSFGGLVIRYLRRKQALRSAIDEYNIRQLNKMYK